MVRQLEEGQYYADLGGGVYKMQTARSGEGKVGGYRIIVFFKSEKRTFCVYGFAKSEKDNIDQGELRALKQRAKDAFSMTEEHIKDRVSKGTLIEVFFGGRV